MRLIDADEMDFTKMKMPKGNALKAVLDFCETQPTAYDVDAVVEQIVDSPYRDSDGFLDPKTTIEIVKAGGKHE